MAVVGLLPESVEAVVPPSVVVVLPSVVDVPLSDVVVPPSEEVAPSCARQNVHMSVTEAQASSIRIQRRNPARQMTNRDLHFMPIMTARF